MPLPEPVDVTAEIGPRRAVPVEIRVQRPGSTPGQVWAWVPLANALVEIGYSERSAEVDAVTLENEIESRDVGSLRLGELADVGFREENVAVVVDHESIRIVDESTKLVHTIGSA